MGPLLAYDAAGNVVATLGHMVALDENHEVVGLIDFEAHEAAGGALTDIWQVDTAVGSGTWPEWLDRFEDFRVERDPATGRIAALVHRTSGLRRDRAAIEAAIAATPIVNGERDIRAIVGGPLRPLALDAHGRAAPRGPVGTPAHLPVVGAGR